ncbi:hypothetical protein FOL47_000552 [Perkinsus chesapeaki]|uniref:Large ribosomal subunit protein bL12 C-terminal domain-containing protein n=1 Tax=Perkinsus chesapeaki TaxID=330153 RepID=A0A7J6N1W8_PERCH|nr:hypothetical protein FOL47_000552 [Perkinsus chesapeaki]
MASRWLRPGQACLRRRKGVRCASTRSSVDENAFNLMFDLKDEKRNHLREIVDEIMTLELRDAKDLADLLEASIENPSFLATTVVPGRRPFPHPMHMFSALDAATRPGMYQPYGQGGILPQTTAPVQHEPPPASTQGPSSSVAESEAPTVEETKKAAAKADSTSVVTLKLIGYEDGKKVTVVKEVRALLGLGLKESKDMVEELPKILKKGMDKSEAQKFACMTYFANPAGQPPPPPGSPPPAAAPPQPEFGYHHQQRHQWSRPQPALPKAALAHPSAEATSPETSPVSVASAPSPHDSDGNVTFGMPHKLGARRGLPAGRTKKRLSPIMHLSADVVCRVSKVIASERRCIALDVVGVPAPRLPEGDSGGHRIVVDHLVIATMHGVTVIGPPTAKGDHKMLRDMLAAQLIGHLKLYRNTVHVVIPRADTVDRTCRFLGLKHGALTGMINVVQWVRKWAAAKKAHGAAVLAKSIVAGLEASGGGELSVETLCNFFLPYKPHFTGPPTENVERLPKHVRSHAMAHVAFFTRKVFLMFFTRATDPDASTVAARSDDSREEECVSVATSQPEPGDPTTTSGKSPMAALSGADVQDMAGVADGIRQLRQGNSGAVQCPQAT